MLDQKFDMKVYIIHRWDGSPSLDWYPWLKEELEKKSFEVFVPKMPEPNHPKIAKNPDEDTYFVGHSIGCQTILRYLEKINKKVGGAVLVAGWLVLHPLE